MAISSPRVDWWSQLKDEATHHPFYNDFAILLL